MASTTKTTLVVETDDGNVIFGLTAKSVTVQSPRGKEVEIKDRQDLRALSDALNDLVTNGASAERPSASRPVKDAPQA
jgi:RNase P/RNase MRP subunit p29